MSQAVVMIIGDDKDVHAGRYLHDDPDPSVIYAKLSIDRGARST